MRFHYYLRTWVNCTLDVIGTVLVIVGALPLFILGVIPLVFLYFTIQVSTWTFMCINNRSSQSIIGSSPLQLPVSSSSPKSRFQERIPYSRV